jgi:uncharacterized protein with PIN domain/endonuclease/exonuclease/phosphatase family metal-dependent hydrolase
MSKVTSSPFRLSFGCWNVLADCYSYGQFPSNADIPQFIGWERRRERIANSIAKCDVDVLCLQEVDHFADFYEPFLNSLNYESVYLQRPNRPDGCLIAYNRQKFEMKAYDEVQFDDIAAFMRSDSSRAKMKRFNVAQITLLQPRGDVGNQNAFVASNTHIYWNPRQPEVKNFQTQYLLGRVGRFLDAHGLSLDNTPILIAGDFNSVPHSEPYKMITEGFKYTFGKGSSMHHKHKLHLPHEHTTAESSSNNAVSPSLDFNLAENPYYGPNTKFLCDRNLSRLCRWLRVLGIDIALIPDAEIEAAQRAVDEANRLAGVASVTEIEEKVSNNGRKVYRKKKQSFDYIFQRARDEKRVILTTSRSMIERAACPPSFFVKTRDLEAALVEVCREFGLSLDQNRFLTVCGKCGGDIEGCTRDDPRIQNKTNVVPPEDKDVFVCVDCHQPYWWNER